MSSLNWSVEGRDFKYKKDYLEALVDKKTIEKIKKEYIWDDFISITSLKNKIEKEEFIFHTLVGADFEDDVYTQYDLLMRKKNNKDPENKKKLIKDKNKDKSKQKNKKQINIEDFDDEMKTRILFELEKKERKRKLFIFLFFCVAFISLSYFFIYDYMQKRTDSDVGMWTKLKEQNIQSNIANEFKYLPNIIIENIGEEELEVLDEYKILIEKNKTLIGWIEIDDTYIDYPVMQTVNNDYYLNHNFNQEKDVNGCIFLDSNSDFIHRDTNLILYGHNMSSGKMFGTLRNYKDKKYYINHPEIKFDTIYEKGTYQVMYVFHGQIYKEEDVAFKYYQFFNAESEKEFNSYMQSMAELSLYDTGVTATFGEQLITLSTCDGSDTTKRFVVVAKRIK